MKPPNPHQSLINKIEETIHTLPDVCASDAPLLALTVGGLTVRLVPSRSAAESLLAKLYKPVKKPRQPVDLKREFWCAGGPFAGARIWLLSSCPTTLPFRGGRYVGGPDAHTVSWTPTAH